MGRKTSRICCATCINLKIQVTANGLMPVCALGIYSFKERERVDYSEDKDINQKKCDDYENYKPEE